jgi:hypothetical protein
MRRFEEAVLAVIIVDQGRRRGGWYPRIAAHLSV